MSRLRFGIFMAPFHSPVGQDPTSAYERDLDVIKQLAATGMTMIMTMIMKRVVAAGTTTTRTNCT